MINHQTSEQTGNFNVNIVSVYIFFLFIYLGDYNLNCSINEFNDAPPAYLQTLIAESEEKDSADHRLKSEAPPPKYHELYSNEAFKVISEKR